MPTSRRFATMDAALNYVDGLPINEVRRLLAEFLTDFPVEKIVISEEQFKKYFRIKGYTEKGEKENRGRKSVTD